MQTVERSLAAARLLRSVWWFVVGVSLAWLVMVPQVQAETIAATATGGNVPATEVWKNGPTTYASKSAAQTAMCAATLGFHHDIMNARTNPANASFRDFCLYAPAPGTVIEAGSTMVTYSCTTGTLQYGAGGAAAAGSVCNTGAVTYSCPSTGGWTLSGSNCTRPDCPAGEMHNATTGVCEVDCALKAGKAPDSNVPGYSAGIIGWYSAGASYSNWAAGSACYGGCRVEAPHSKCTKGGSDPLVYNCGMAGATYTGAACNGTEGAAAASTGTESPADKSKKTSGYDCLKAGMAAGTVSGTIVCYESPTSSTTSTKTTSSTPGSGTGGSTTATTTRTDCDGDKCTTTTTSSTTSGGSGAGGTGAGSSTAPGATVKDTEAKDSYCEAHPDADICAKDDAGTPGGTDGLYTKGSRTVAEAFADFKGTVAGAPFYSAAAGYFSAGSIPSGSCSGLVMDVAVMGGSFHLDPGAVLCGSVAASFYTVLGIGMMLAAGWVAFRIAIL